MFTPAYAETSMLFKRSLMLSTEYISIQLKTAQLKSLKPGFHQRINMSVRALRTCRMGYLTQFLIPALLNPMINKMADEASAILLFICSHEVWVNVTYDWSMALYLCRSSFSSQSYDISTSTRRTNLSVFLVLMLMLMSTQFSLAHTCACAYAYNVCLYASENYAFQLFAGQ